MQWSFRALGAPDAVAAELAAFRDSAPTGAAAVVSFVAGWLEGLGPEQTASVDLRWCVQDGGPTLNLALDASWVQRPDHDALTAQLLP